MTSFMSVITYLDSFYYLHQVVGFLRALLIVKGAYRK